MTEAQITHTAEQARCSLWELEDNKRVLWQPYNFSVQIFFSWERFHHEYIYFTQKNNVELHWYAFKCKITNVMLPDPRTQLTPLMYHISCANFLRRCTQTTSTLQIVPTSKCAGNPYFQPWSLKCNSFLNYCVGVVTQTGQAQDTAPAGQSVKI